MVKKPSTCVEALWSYDVDLRLTAEDQTIVIVVR
jgi:hypothetical protein